MIMDLRHYDGSQITSTKLENAIQQIFTAMGAGAFTADYYDFRYPNATHLLLIAEAIYPLGSETFEVNLPGDLTYYEKSWTHALEEYYPNLDGSTLYLNDVAINYLDKNDDWSFGHGSFVAAQLPVDTFHIIKVDLTGPFDRGNAFAGLAIIYQDVP